MKQYLGYDTVYLFVAVIAFIVLLIVVFFINKHVFSIIKKRVYRTSGKVDEHILNFFKIPALLVIYFIFFKLFTSIFLKSLSFYDYLEHLNTLILIFTITWIIIQFINAGSYKLQNSLNIGVPDNLIARKKLTQIKIFRGVVNFIIIVISISVSLLTFKEARAVGMSLLTSAGIVGIIIGFAAQKSIGMILGGIQLAITQPIRLDDVLFIEGEWGRVEEITLTYVVVKIWDERRLVLPATRFLEQPFQNWTRTSANIIGTVFLYVDYNFPVESIRAMLPGILKDNPYWDQRVSNVQVTNVTENYKEIRLLLSSANSSNNWELKVFVREKLIDFINDNFPHTFSKIRITQE
jgi:small-conductance mechanosensitive channel